MLDSGVFSTWTLGKKVDIDAYAQYCKDNDEIVTVYVNCDVIPGRYGEIPTAQEVEDSAAKGWDNFMYLIDKGLPAHRIIHVFHQGEDFKWLEKLMDHNEERVEAGEEPLYIGLSPANDRTTKQKILWLDQCMPYVTTPDGSAKVKWHGFGVTATKIMRRYPWYTVDSTSWMRAGAYGQLKIPARGEKLPFLDSRLQIALTAGAGISQADKHYGSFSDKEKDAIKKYLKTIDLSIDDVCQDGNEGVRHRQFANIHYWKQMEKELNTLDLRWKKPQETFL